MFLVLFACVAVLAKGKKRVAVIGGGACGICSVKTLKEEGVEPICFEKTGYYGGTWRYHEDDVEGNHIFQKLVMS